MACSSPAEQAAAQLKAPEEVALLQALFSVRPVLTPTDSCRTFAHIYEFSVLNLQRLAAESERSSSYEQSVPRPRFAAEAAAMGDMGGRSHRPRAQCIIQYSVGFPLGSHFCLVCTCSKTHGPQPQISTAAIAPLRVLLCHGHVLLWQLEGQDWRSFCAAQ